MRKIKSTHYLILAVMLIWIGVILRLISFRRPSREVNSQFSVTSPVREKENKFTREKLFLSYPDPFLKTKHSPVKSIVENNIRASFIKSIPQWPQVEYCGYVEDKSTGIKNINLKVNNKSYLARVNQIVGGVRIRRIARDSIKIEYRGDIRTIYNKP